MADILQLCKLAEFPKVAAPATKPKFLFRPMWVRNYEKTIHSQQQHGTQSGNWTIKLPNQDKEYSIGRHSGSVSTGSNLIFPKETPLLHLEFPDNY